MRARLPDRIHHLPLALIDDQDRLRPVNPNRVTEIVASWNLNGQLTPIEVAPADAEGVHPLIAGAHRLAAARQMGEPSIAAVIVEVTDEDARKLREIDENLYRAELSPLDQAVFLAERKAIFDRLNGETRGKNKGLGKTAETAVIPKGRSFAADTAEAIGLSERMVFVALSRFRDLSEASRKRLRGTHLADNGAELDALCKRTAEQQAAILDLVLPRAGDPQATSIRAAWKMLDSTEAEDPEAEAEAQMKRLRAAWNAAEPEVQAAFLAWAKKQLREGGR